MVRLRFEEKKLEDLDFWTKSDPYLTLSRPAKNGSGAIHLCKMSGVTSALMFCIPASFPVFIFWSPHLFNQMINTSMSHVRTLTKNFKYF